MVAGDDATERASERARIVADQHRLAAAINRLAETSGYALGWTDRPDAQALYAQAHANEQRLTELEAADHADVGSGPATTTQMAQTFAHLHEMLDVWGTTREAAKDLAARDHAMGRYSEAVGALEVINAVKALLEAR
jgi:hypothetical protein